MLIILLLINIIFSVSAIIMSNGVILVVGATGNIGKTVVTQLLQRNYKVRIIIRKTNDETIKKLKTEYKDKLDIIQASLLDISNENLQTVMQDCGAVVSCLGHGMNLKGIWGPPYFLCYSAVKALAEAAISIQKTKATTAATLSIYNNVVTPIKIILFSSVSVYNLNGRDTVREWGQNIALSMLRTLIPPVWDNQAAADYLVKQVGDKNKDPIEYCIVRPDAFVADFDGDISEYKVFETLQTSLFQPRKTRKNNSAHFICELIAKENVWNKWKFKLPVVLDKTTTE